MFVDIIKVFITGCAVAQALC